MHVNTLCTQLILKRVEYKIIVKTKKIIYKNDKSFAVTIS